MDREKLKLIVRNLESLVECLKAEIKEELGCDIDLSSINFDFK